MTNRMLTVLLAGVSFASLQANADDFTATAPISDVVVYRDGGATITRKGTITLTAGRHSLTIDRLTKALDEDQLFISFDNPAIKLYGSKTGTSYVVNPASDRQAEIQKKLEALQARDNALKSDEQAKDMQLGFLRSLNQKSDTQALPLDDWQKALAFIGEQSAKLLADIETIRQDRRNLAEERAALMRELKDTGPQRQDFTTATFEVETPTSGELAYSVSYFIEDAEWSLGIEGALNTASKSLTIRPTATVEQQSGEDWSNVSLALSTTAPSEDLGEIVQFPEFLTLYDPKEDASRMRFSKPQAMAPMPTDAAYEEVVVTGTRIESKTTSFDRLYMIGGTVSIASSGDQEIFDLAETRTDVELVVRANPSDTTTAYLFADTELKDFESLREVYPNLRRDGHYVGTGEWPNLVSNTPLQLPYGEDSAISIEYTEQAPNDGDSGLFGSKKVEEKRFLISVTNNHPEARTVEIFDQIPVAAHEDIKIRMLPDATKPTETDMDGKQGLMKWRKTLAPGEVWQIKHQYRVTYPADMRLRQR